MSASSRSNFLTAAWRTLREAVAGGERDYTVEAVGRAVTLLAIPMVLEMVMESVFAVVDAWFVLRIGVDAGAAVGMTEAVVTIVYALAVGMSAAATAMVARRVGEKKLDEARAAAVQALGLGLLVSVVIAIAGVILAPSLLRLMGGSEAVVAIGTGYTRVLLAGCPTIVLLFMGNAIFRGAGDASLAMRVLWIANLINLALDPCLIFGLGPFPELGLTGAAIATTIGRGTGVLLQLWLLGRGSCRVSVGGADLRLDWPVMRRLVRLSAGGIGQYMISTSSWILLVRLVGGFGSAAVAGYMVAIRFFTFVLMPAWGMSNAAATLVGQNLGAGLPERAVASVRRTALYNVVFLFVVSVLFFWLDETMIGWFTDDAGVIDSGAACLRILAFVLTFYACGMVLVAAFNGAGDTTTPTILNFFCYWLLQLPLAWFLSQRTALGAHGVYWSIVAADMLLTVLAIILFRRGRWKSQVV